MSVRHGRRWRRNLRRLLRWLQRGLIALLIGAALLVAAASQLLPLLARHPERVAEWLSRQVDAPVRLSQVTVEWNRAGPEFSLSGLRIGVAPEVLDIGQARLQVNIYSGLWPGMPLTELRLSGPELELRRDLAGQWRLEGLGHRPVGATGGSQLDQLGRFGAIDVLGARLHFRDEPGRCQFRLPRIDARLQQQHGRLQLGALVHDDAGGRLRLAGEISRDLHQGRAFLEGRAQHWSAWLASLPCHDLPMLEARGDLRAWVGWQNDRLIDLQLDVKLDSLALPVADAAAGAPAPAQSDHLALGAWDLVLRLERGAGDGWSLSIPHWRVIPAGDAAAPTASAIEVVRDGQGRKDPDGTHRFQARKLALAPLAQLAPMMPQMPGFLGQWLAVARPAGELTDVDVIWRDTGRFELQAMLEQLGWASHRGVPGIQGISGTLDGSDGVIRLQLRPGVWQVQAGGVMRQPFQPRMQGEILLFRDQDAWRVDTPDLQLAEDDYAITLAGGAEFSAAGGALLDLRADVARAPLVVAKRFWPVNTMPPPVMDWLDAALLDGEVAHGAALVRGDVLDWPFRHGEGRFEALAELDGARLRFHEDWPEGQAINGYARFINEGMEVELEGEVVGVTASQVRGGIPDFGDAVLGLEVQGTGTGSALLRLLRASPLREDYGDFLDHLELGGRGHLALTLTIPLEDHLGEPGVDGRVDIERMDLHDADWGLDFSAASGRVRFSEGGFSADELNVGFADSLAALSIAVGDYTADGGNLVEASLRGRFSAAALTAASQYSQWAQPWFSGESDWNLQLSVPRADPGRIAPAHPGLRVRSDLAGTAITLPAPLRKAADEQLPLDLHVGLPLDESGVRLRLGNLLQVEGRFDASSGFSGQAIFGTAHEPGRPAAGLLIAGQVPVLDVAAWLSALGDTAGAGKLQLDAADLFVGELNLFGRRFRETGIGLQRDDAKLEISLDGDALRGRVEIPSADLLQKGITAHFERLYWPGEDEGEAADDASRTPGPGLVAPALVPPLHLESLDTRFAEAQLGTVWLETWPTAEGLHVERLDTHSPAMDIKAKGDWVRTLAGERTRLKLDYSSHNVGDLLEAMGFSRLIDGGGTHGQLQLDWQGSPAAFDWARTDGQLDISIAQGRVLEVEPGAGRLFGLLSLTEIPRRLSLDFSDFFKSGFAFNQMAGGFEIRKGDAFTESFRIDAPSARILLSGRTGLKARDYDQTMEVAPKAGSVLPAIGAIAGGPAGAAVGAVAQAVLNQPLKEMTRTSYRITGPWSEPKIETAEHGGD